MVQPFTVPIPEAFLKDSGVAEWARQVTLYLDELSRPEGVLANAETTTATVLTQGEKLDLVTITQGVNLDTVESQAAAATQSLADLRNSLPTYTISNDGTVRTLNADGGNATISNPPTQAEVQAMVSYLNIIGDVLSTVIRDLKNKQIFGV